MNKAELIEKVAYACSMTKKDTSLVLTALLDEIGTALSEGEKVQLVGFGVFEPRIKPEHVGVNPVTLEEMTIPETRTVSFKPGKKLRESL
ncbi:MAG: HU family DNA-binding protein [Clostridia bacterium]|nr:HU family DNA-binding protein [Clostridia bacterium]